jgi:hypothetical protein
MQPAEILITMVCEGAIIARNPTIGTFLLRASNAAKFVSAPISGLDVQHLIGRDLISATSTTQDGMEIYLLTAEGRRHARSISREIGHQSVSGSFTQRTIITADS